MDMSLKKYVFMVIVPSFLIALGIPLVFGYIDKNTVIAIPWYAKYFLPASLVMLSLLIPIIISVAKKAEIERYMKQEGVNVQTAIRDVLGVEV